MKKLLLILIALCPVVVQANVRDTNKDTKYRWSYGALADTMKEMRNNCEITHKDEFLEMGNWMRNKNAVFSFNELKTQCETQSHQFSAIDRTYKDKNGNIKKCEMPLPCDGKKCSEKQYTNNSGCNIFITEFIKNHNLREKILNTRKPGTYVRKIKLKSGGTAYQIVDVVLAPGYWQNDKINNDVNNNVANTKIYDISTGDIIDTGMQTWTNDMFFDVAADPTKKGNVGGAFVKSYIRPEMDLTNEIYAMYDKRRGEAVTNTTGNFNDSWTEGDFDIKGNYAPKYKIVPQTDVESHTNGVVFDGKIANLDWLGHLLFGMNREESTLPAGLANFSAQTLSVLESMKRHVSEEGIKGVLAKGDKEPLKMQNAWDIGSDLVADNKTKRITTFAKVQTKTEQEAYQKAAQEMKKIYPDATGISCIGNCNKIPGTDDIVICTDSSKRRLEFVFDDICHTDATSTVGNTYSGPGVYFRPGMR